MKMAEPELKVTRDVIEAIMHPQPVNVNDMLDQVDRENLIRFLDRGKIDDSYAGASSGGATILIGKYNRHNSRWGEGYIEGEPQLCVSSRKELDELARKNGLQVIECGEWDRDGVFEMHYQFRDPQKEKKEEDEKKRRIELEKEAKVEAMKRRKWNREHPEEHRKERIGFLETSYPDLKNVLGSLKRYCLDVEGRSQDESQRFAEEYVLGFYNKSGFDTKRKLGELASRIDKYLEDRFDLPSGSKLDLEQLQKTILKR